MFMRANKMVQWVNAFAAKPVWSLGPIRWKERTDLCRSEGPWLPCTQAHIHISQKEKKKCSCACTQAQIRLPPELGCWELCEISMCSNLSCFFSPKLCILRKWKLILYVNSAGVGVPQRVTRRDANVLKSALSFPFAEAGPLCICCRMAYFKLVGKLLPLLLCLPLISR